MQQHVSKRRQYAKPRVVEQGKITGLTQGGNGDDVETGKNIVWGTAPVSDPGPRKPL